METKIENKSKQTLLPWDPPVLSYGWWKRNDGVRVVQSARFFLKFVTEPIGIGFLIIKTNAYRLGSVFRPIVVWFGRFGLIGLVGLKH